MKSKIKVAFFAESLLQDVDGAVRTMYQLINRIPTNQFEFLFITGELPYGEFPHEIMQVPSIKLPFNETYKMSLSFLVSDKIKEKLSSFKPNIIHIATPSPMGHFASNYAQKRSIPMISIYHTHFLSYVDYYLKNLPILLPTIRNRMISDMQKFYNACDLVYVPTNRMKLELSEIGVFSNHLKLWQRGLKKDLFSPDKRDLTYIRSLTKNTKPNILFASRLVWEKNLNTLANIYKEIKKKALEYNIIIAGDGTAKSTLQKMMPEAIFLGKLNHEQLSKTYASSDIFLFPSVSETYGNVVIEALASGLPCVIANGGGTIDLINHSHNGIICDPHEPSEYLDAIHRILNNNNLRQTLIKNGLESVKGLSWDRLVEDYFNDLSFLANKPQIKVA